MTPELKVLKLDGVSHVVQSPDLGDAKVLVATGDLRDFSACQKVANATKGYAGTTGILIDISTCKTGRIETFVSMMKAACIATHGIKTKIPVAWVALSRPSGACYILWVNPEHKDFKMDDITCSKVDKWHLITAFKYPNPGNSTIDVIRNTSAHAGGAVASVGQVIASNSSKLFGWAKLKSQGLIKKDKHTITVETDQ